MNQVVLEQFLQLTSFFQLGNGKSGKEQFLQHRGSPIKSSFKNKATKASLTDM